MLLREKERRILRMFSQYRGNCNLRDGCNFKESNRSGQNIMKNQSYLWKYLYSGVLRIVRPTSWKTINDCKIYFSHHNSSKITQQECKRNLNTVSRRKHETLSKSSTRPIENCAISHTKKLLQIYQLKTVIRLLIKPQILVWQACKVIVHQWTID